MYNVFNTDCYFLYDVWEKTVTFIGDKNDLIIFLSRKTRTYFYTDKVRWGNDYFDNINMGNDHSHIKHYLVTDNNYDFYYDNSEKRYMFYDRDGRIIDVRQFKDETFEFYAKNKYVYPYRKNKSKTMGRKYHSGYSFKNKFPRVKDIHKMDSIIDSINKEYDINLKKLSSSKNDYPCWWDDTSRRISGNWKHQKKTRHQYGGNNISIRYSFIEEEDDSSSIFL